MKLDKKTIVVIILSLLMTAVVWYLAAGYVNTETARRLAQQKTPTRAIIVAAANLPEGTLLSQQNLAVREFPRDLVSATWFAAEDAGAIVGTELGFAINAGDPIPQTAVLAIDQQSLSRRLPSNQVAISVALDERQIPAQQLRVGDKVDLAFVADDGKRLSAVFESLTILLITGQDSASSDGAYQQPALVLAVPTSAAPLFSLFSQARAVIWLQSSATQRSTIRWQAASPGIQVQRLEDLLEVHQ